MAEIKRCGSTFRRYCHVEVAFNGFSTAHFVRSFASADVLLQRCTMSFKRSFLVQGTRVETRHWRSCWKFWKSVAVFLALVCIRFPKEACKAQAICFLPSTIFSVFTSGVRRKPLSRASSFD